MTATAHRGVARTSQIGARRAALVPATVVVQVIVAVLVAGLASSRADDNVLSALALAGLAVGAAMASAIVAWPAGLYAGALEVLDGGPEPDCDASCSGANDDDPFTGSALRRRALGLTLAVGAWALASAGLLAAVLDNRPARVAVIVAALVGIAAGSAVVIDGAARHRGAHAAVRHRTRPPAPVPLRRRAWREVALPLAVAQLLVNAGVAWVLFHDDPVHDPFARDALTRSSAFADVPIVVTILALVFAIALAGAWGAVDARLGRVELDDPDVQRARGTEPFGPQAIVYLALSGFALATAIGFVLPSSPTLTQVMIARGVFAGVLVALFSAVGYVRGALNAEAAAP
jgi:MFS family permease